MFEQLISLIAPHYCINCQKMGTELCPDCKNNIIFEPLVRCVECHQFLHNNICRSCTLPYQFIASLSRREGVIKDIIDAFKFYGNRSAAVPLADMLIAQLPYFPGDSVVTYVPTARSHIRQRGYDHAAVLARSVAKQRRVEYKCLLVRKHTARQVGSTRAVRLKQAVGLYECRKKLNAQTTYILIDDIITTGATVRNAAKALHAAGARKIVIATLAYQSGS